MSTVLDHKSFATLQARCALAGVALHVGDDDHGAPLFIVSRWGLTRQLDSAEQVEQFLRRFGAA